MGREITHHPDKVHSLQLSLKPRRNFGHGLQLKDIASRRVNARKPLKPAFGRHRNNQHYVLPAESEPSDSSEPTSALALAYIPDLPTEGTQANTGDLSSLAIYRSEIGGIPLMTSQQRTDLAQKIEEGDLKAFDQFIEGNLKLVLVIARSFEGNELPLEDLVQAGNLGLMWAVERFDRHRKNEFSTYARYWIEKAIREARLDTGRTGLPRHTQFELCRLEDAYSKLTQSLQREPKDEELAAELELSPARVAQLERARQHPTSLYRKPYPGSGVSIADLLVDRTAEDPANVTIANWERQSLRDLLEEMFPVPEDRLILWARFGLTPEITVAGRPPAEVAKRLGLPVEHVNMRLSRMLVRLRQPWVTTKLLEFQGLLYN